MSDDASRRRKVGELMREVRLRPRVGLSPYNAKLFIEDRRTSIASKMQVRLELYGINKELNSETRED